MPPKNTIKLGPGTMYYHEPEGLSPLYALEEAPEIEAEAPEWPKENPYIKPTKDATFTAEARISPEVSEAFTKMGEACKKTAEALVDLLRAAVGCVVAIARGVDIAQLLKTAKVQAALNEAPPRVRHLATHGKKYRTRKKNVNRALREYRRRSRKRD